MNRLVLAVDEMSSIFVSQTDEYNVFHALKNAFDFFRIRFDFKVAAVKLNLCSLKMRETGATSDPIVVEQMVKILNNEGVHVRLVESNSASRDADLAFEYLGFKSLEKKYDVKCINLSRDEFSIKKIDDGYYLKSVQVPKAIETADFFITHPKLKTHSSMGVRLTGGLKNQFGCLMKKDKASYHSMIHEVIADVNEAMTPNLAVMDAIISMTGYGPTTGMPLRLNQLIVSQDSVAIDAFGAQLFGFNPDSIKYLRLASKKSLGNMNSVLYGDRIKRAHIMPINKYVMRSFEILSSLGIKEVSET
jgi:uncharacterized protein (DUF362 family)